MAVGVIAIWTDDQAVRDTPTVLTALSALLQDAVGRAVAVARNAGVSALLVHALNEHARGFYEHYGFPASPVHPMTLMLRLAGT